MHALDLPSPAPARYKRTHHVLHAMTDTTDRKQARVAESELQHTSKSSSPTSEHEVDDGKTKWQYYRFVRNLTLRLRSYVRHTVNEDEPGLRSLQGADLNTPKRQQTIRSSPSQPRSGHTCTSRTRDS